MDLTTRHRHSAFAFLLAVPLMTLVACGGSDPSPSAAAPTAAKPVGGATVASIATVVTTRDPYAVPTASPGAGPRITVTATAAPPTSTTVPMPTQVPALTQVATVAPATPAAVATTQATPTVEAAAPTAAPSVVPTSMPAPVTEGLSFKIQAEKSSATFRVNEQLAGRDLPNDAVGTTKAVSGQLVFAPDGTLSPDKSLILVDLNTLKTDSGSRDNYLKRNTLEVDKFPNASFAPSKAEGMPSPLPAAGEASFTMTGMTSIHGIQKEVTWKVTAKRDGATITGKATATVMFGDFGMTIPRAAAVLSVKDEIRLEIDLSATAE